MSLIRSVLPANASMLRRNCAALKNQLRCTGKSLEKVKGVQILCLNIPKHKKKSKQNMFFIYIVANVKLNGDKNPVLFSSINLIYLIIKISQAFIKSIKKILMSLTIPKRSTNQKTYVHNYYNYHEIRGKLNILQ